MNELEKEFMKGLEVCYCESGKDFLDFKPQDEDEEYFDCSVSINMSYMTLSGPGSQCTKRIRFCPFCGRNLWESK